MNMIMNDEKTWRVKSAEAMRYGTAILGVAGSGKTNLAIRLLDAYRHAGARVLILDPKGEMTRWRGNLKAEKPAKLHNIRHVQTWLAGNSTLGIYQSETETDWPGITIDVSKECLKWLATQPKSGSSALDTPKLCLVLDDADRLVPQDQAQLSPGEISGVKTLVQQKTMGLHLISQTVSGLNRMMLDRLQTFFAFRLCEQSSLSFVQQRLRREDARMLFKLPAHEALVMGKGSPMGNPVIISVPEASPYLAGEETDLQQIGNWRIFEPSRGVFSAEIYRLDGNWYMDDPQKEIVLEELIRGMPEIIEHLVGERTDRFICTFSDWPLPWPSAILVLEKNAESQEGGWYVLQGTSLRGWLCPTIYRYFTNVPNVIFLHVHVPPIELPMNFEKSNKKGNKK